jgi:hypothetical protein
MTPVQDTPEGSYQNGTRTLTREHLASDTIEGIYVLGTRAFWYSDELQTNLAVRRIDPMLGKQAIRLSGISRSEPDPHLWDVPIGFTVRDLRADAKRRKQMRPGQIYLSIFAHTAIFTIL